MKYCFGCDKPILINLQVVELGRGDNEWVTFHRSCASSFNVGRSIEIGKQRKSKEYYYVQFDCPLCKLPIIEGDYVYEEFGVRHHEICVRNSKKEKPGGVLNGL